MKPRSLHLQQFGPYTDHIVDFEPFLAEGLFLIHGDTGSGKSTLLDALSFALFGKGLGSREGEEHLRNKTAAPDSISAVTLEFTLGDARYRVRRTMAHERPSRRGGGLTKQPAEALIECAEGDPSFVSVTQPAKVTEAVERLLKLQREQFSRIIVLPQGEFRELLLATAKDRERLLEQIFGSELYKSIERALHDMDKRAEQAVLALGERSASLMASAGAADRDALAAMKSSAETELAVARETLGALSSSLSAQLDALEEARNAHGRNARRAALSSALATLTTRGAEVESLRREVDAAARAERSLGAMAAVERATSALEASQRAVFSCESEIAAATEALGRDELSDARRDALESERARLITRRESLEAQRRDAEKFAAEARARTAAREATERAREAFEAAARQGEALESELSALGVEAAAKRAKAAGEGVAALRRQELSQRLDSARAKVVLDGRRLELDRASRESERRVKAAEARATAAKTARDALRTRNRAAMAAQLAESLTDGEACPVCGSSAHPRRATHAEAEVEREALTAAEDALDEADEALKRAAQRHARELGELSGVQTQLLEASAADPATELELAAMLKHAQRALSEVQEARQEAEKLDRACAALGAQRATAESKRAECERALAVCAAREAARSDSVEEPREAVSPEQAQRALDEAREALSATEARLASLAQLRASWSARREAAEARRAETREAHEGARAAARSAAEELTKTLVAQGFSAIDEAREARRDESVWRALRQRVIEHDDAVLRAQRERDALGEPEPEADLDALERESALTRRTLDASQQAVGSARTQSESLSKLLEQVDAGGQERVEKEAALARVRKVADLANGRSEGRVRLSRYVLLDQFDRVVEAASTRLDLMSDGRFRLRRRESRAVGTEFELMVEDAYTGAAERSAATLSGGEMFLASLAMALGLSDVVQQHAGGVRIESLFVDEGFGSLDEESLDKAVMVLEQLQANKRLVGVVSHVPELRKRIASKLEVLRTDSGSITRSSERHRAKTP